VLTLKLQVWDELPWKLACLAHVDEGAARKAARIILQKFDTAPDPEVNHRLSLKFCAQGSPMRAELERFVAGASRNELPLLLQNVARLRFVKVVERTIERPHGALKKSILGKRHGPLSVAMALRSPEVERDIVPNETLFERFVALAGQTINIKHIPRLLQIDGHPWLRRAFGEKASSEKFVVALSYILYRSDDVSLFQSHDIVRKRHHSAVADRKKAAKPFLHVERLQFDFKAVLTHAATARFREACNTGDIYIYIYIFISVEFGSGCQSTEDSSIEVIFVQRRTREERVHRCGFEGFAGRHRG
jgi:hypothetical protein